MRNSDINLHGINSERVTSHDVRCQDTGSEESAREEVACGGHADVEMDAWSHTKTRWAVSSESIIDQTYQIRKTGFLLANAMFLCGYLIRPKEDNGVETALGCS